MKFSTGLASSVLLATTAQACVRIYVNEVFTSDTSSTRTLTLWDQDKVSAYRIPYDPGNSDPYGWRGEGYLVELKANYEGSVVYPNNGQGDLSVQARRETTLDNGQKQVESCLWDNYDCGNYVCGLP